jgi:hypothetical protein
MVLELTQPLTELSTGNISWGVKAAGAYGWQTYHLHVPIVLKCGSLNLLELSVAVQACNGILNLYLTIVIVTRKEQFRHLAERNVWVSFQSLMGPNYLTN